MFVSWDEELGLNVMLNSVKILEQDVSFTDRKKAKIWRIDLKLDKEGWRKIHCYSLKMPIKLVCCLMEDCGWGQLRGRDLFRNQSICYLPCLFDNTSFYNIEKNDIKIDDKVDMIQVKVEKNENDVDISICLREKF